MAIVNFTPWTALGGGLLIGGAALLLLAFNGKIAGISGIAKGLLGHCPTPHERFWRLAFVAGLLAGGWAVVSVAPEVTASAQVLPPLHMVLGGLLVGVGTAMGNGCTSGHGVCGLGRRSPRSLASVLTFIGAGMATVWLMNLMGIARL